MLTVNGQTVVSDKLIDSALAREIARINGIEPTGPELDAMRKKWNRAAAALKGSQPPGAQPELAEIAAMKKKMNEGWVEAMALSFKLNRLLWNKHGGRLVLSAFGMHQATDAFAAEVLELERMSVARFHTTAAREAFFRRMQTYTGDGVTGGERARRILSAPPWE